MLLEVSCVHFSPAPHNLPPYTDTLVNLQVTAVGADYHGSGVCQLAMAKMVAFRCKVLPHFCISLRALSVQQLD